jgi:curli production assembly/transport component CsgF
MSLHKVEVRLQKSRLQAKLAGAAAWSLLAAPAMAGQLIYTPVNPSFGGNPLNGTYMLQSAQSQKRYSYPLDDLDTPGSGDLKILNAGDYPIIQVGSKVYIYDPNKSQWMPFDPNGVQAGASLGASSSSSSTATSTQNSSIDSGVLK